MEEKNTEIRETQAPEQNTPVAPNETDKVEMTVKDGSKTSVPKWLIVTVIVMAVVIIGLAVTLVMVLTGGKQEESSQTGSSAVSNISSETVSSDSSDNVDNSNVSADNSQPAVTENGIVLQYSVDNSWGDEGNLNYGVQFGITNNTDSGISGWELVIEVDGLKSCDGWNGTYTQNGNTVTVTNAEYNGDIQTGATVVIGCNLNTDKELKINKATLNNVDCVVKAGNVNQNNQNNQNNQSGNNGNDSANVDVDALLERSKDAEQGDDWLHTDGNKILDKDGKQVWLTGVNWFGYNTGTNTFDGLWNSELKPSVKAIADHGFNLIRVPMSAELINSWAAGEYPQANYNNAYNTELNSMNSLQIFDYFLKLAEENGIKVMPDIHSAETNASGHTVNLWYTDKVSAEDYYKALEWMAERYKDNDTIIAYDLKNEPHGKPYEADKAAIWNDSKADNNWKYVAETAAARILAKNPNVLIMVEGTEIYPTDINSNKDYHSTNDDDYYFNWWGGNLRGVKDFPVNLGKYQDKLVYSPHDYGPTVYQQPWFEGSYDFDSLMRDCWQDNWFYIYKNNTAPLLIGEWGGFMKEPNLKWMTCMRRLISENHLNHTFWCYNANSGDTGGLVLDDFSTWDEEKYAFVKEVLWQENGKFVGLDHKIALGENGITLKDAKGL
ncbi:MAG: cellulase family glycosylhydrolase [Ruminiclostridium sp.]